MNTTSHFGFLVLGFALGMIAFQTESVSLPAAGAITGKNAQVMARELATALPADFDAINMRGEETNTSRKSDSCADANQVFMMR